MHISWNLHPRRYIILLTCRCEILSKTLYSWLIVEITFSWKVEICAVPYKFIPPVTKLHFQTTCFVKGFCSSGTLKLNKPTWCSFGCVKIELRKNVYSFNSESLYEHHLSVSSIFCRRPSFVFIFCRNVLTRLALSKQFKILIRILLKA